MLTSLVSLLLFLQSPEDARLPTFEVATVKPLDPKGKNFIRAQILPGGKLRLTSQHLTQLVAGAWMVPLYNVDGPKEINLYGYNIEAQPPQDDSSAVPKVDTLGARFPEISMLRLRALIIDRFHLKYHLENRERLTYDLVVSKQGHNLLKKPLSDVPLQCYPTQVVSKGRPMSELAKDLAILYFWAPVYDKTGLTDPYDFSITFEDPKNPPAARDNPLPTIFSAIQDLGLRLIPQKRMVPVLVIDHFEQPSAN
jgi:uncharacterized protein (TIGR03435 family)